MGKNRTTRDTSGGGQPVTPTETPEQFQQRYDEAQKQLENLTYYDKNGNLKNVFTKPQVKKILDNILNENIHLTRVRYNQLTFEERFADGSTTSIRFANSTLKQLLRNDAEGLNVLMTEYNNHVPEFGRKSLNTYIIGQTGKNGNGGFYSPGSNTVNLNSSMFTKSNYNSQWTRHVLQHETTHALDSKISGESGLVASLMGTNMASTKTSKFEQIKGSEVGSAYSESNKYNSHYLPETLAEIVTATRLAKVYGGNVYMDGHPYAGGLTYNEWKKDNPRLAKFAEDFVNCKTENDYKKLFEIED